jgi:hypothetical protein
MLRNWAVVPLKRTFCPRNLSAFSDCYNCLTVSQWKDVEAVCVFQKNKLSLIYENTGRSDSLLVVAHGHD